MLKRYLVFTFPEFYPGGGWSDFVGSYDTLEEAIAVADASKDPNREVIDTTTCEDVYSYPGQRG